ncbi:MULTISPECIES: MBL fold metallo-hydrolase [unclassified Agromyces]|uniref:MBL fold metallo-hydrolase n=1 Tax=unclassified Agromyces TaxID=2639701 RepID=UPI003014AA85
MLEPVAEGVLVHVSEFIASNSVIVQGADGVLLVDPGLTRTELATLAHDLAGAGRRVVAGFSTHPDWDHVLWHPDLGDAPRYGTARNAAAMRELLSQPDWIEQVAEGLPPEYADDIPMELLGLITALPADAATVPWNGPTARIIEHRAHAPGHAALLVEAPGVLVAGDMLSDLLIPFLDLQADDPTGDYLDALQRFEALAEEVEVVVPGHGSVGGREEFRARLDLDRAYVEAVRDGRRPDDPRVGPSAPLDWLAEVDEWQRERLAQRHRATSADDSPPG